MPLVLPVTDPDDPRIAGYRAIRDRDLRDGHGGRFVAEGESVLKVALGPGRFAMESLLAAENRVETALALAGGRDLPVYAAAPGVMDAVVGFSIHRGLLGLGRRGQPAAAADLLAGRPPLVVALSGIANHDNVGGIFRNAAAFGAGAVLMDRATCDPLYRKALRVSVGGVLTVPFAVLPTTEAIIGLLADAGYQVLGLSPRGRRRLDAVDRSGPVALLLGTEGPGLSEASLAATQTVRIDMAAGFDSLNVATTSGIALYELTRRGSA